MRVASRIILTESERAELEALVASAAVNPRLAQRAQMILLAAAGCQNKDIAARVGVGRVQVARWRDRYAVSRLPGIEQDLSGGTPPVRTDVARLAPLARKTAPEARGARQLAAGIAGGSPCELTLVNGLDTLPAGTPAALAARHLPFTSRTLPEDARPSALRALKPVASDKCLPPRHPRKLMPRDTLMNRLLAARRQRCVVIQGQAGAGKTCTLMAWRQALISLGFDVSWLGLAGEDDDPARFLDCLLASLSEVDPALARDAAMLPVGDPDDAIEHAVIALVQALAQHERELVLMIDDLHHVSDPRIYRMLQRLLDYAPPRLHLALGSRSALPLALEPLRARGLLTEIDMRDLRFTPEESARFLQAQLGTISSRDAAALHALTDGWVAGLQLFAADLRVRQCGGYPLAQVRDPRTFAAYFEREVLGRLASEDLAMLTRMASCQRFCADLCAAMPGETESHARIVARLARLDADNLFIMQVGRHDRDIWYRIHPLLRETLLARGGEGPQAHDGEVRALHAAAWRWFDQRGHLDDAVYHAVRAGEAEAAGAMVESRGQAMLARGELSQLSALLRKLPPAQVRGRFGLLTLVAFVQLYARDTDGLGQSLAQLERLGGRPDPVQRYAVLLLRAGRAVQLDDPDTVLGLLPALWDIPAEAEDMWWISRSNVLSWFLILQGEYDEARRLQDDTERRSGAPRSSLFGRYITAMSLVMEGETEQAGRIAREVLRESERQGATYHGLTCMAAGLLADILYELNDPEGACQLLEPRIAMLERMSLPDVVMRALTLLANAHWLAGRRAQSGACLDRLEAYAVRYGLDRLLATALLLRLRRHLQQGEMERANAALQRMHALVERHAGERGTVVRQIALAAARAGIEMALHTRDYAGAAARIEALLADEGNDKSLRTAPLWLQLGLARRALGNAHGARTAFLGALRIGHGAGLVRTLLDATGGTPQAFSTLVGEGVPEPVLAFYARRLHAAAAVVRAPAFRPSGGTGPMAALSEREREILGLLAQAMSNKKIASVLSVSPETVKWHLKNIYTKLGVNGRGRAAARLRDFAARDPGGVQAAA